MGEDHDVWERVLRYGRRLRCVTSVGEDLGVWERVVRYWRRLRCVGEGCDWARINASWGTQQELVSSVDMEILSHVCMCGVCFCGCFFVSWFFYMWYLV